jgi:hypothetical protein
MWTTVATFILKFVPTNVWLAVWTKVKEGASASWDWVKAKFKRSE